ncbi:MAG: hypothetical protein FWD28_09235 [Treponema sp.]|nr:hypothetical protein [Treponema sp.]
MKRKALFFIFFAVSMSFIYAQRIPVVGVAAVETAGGGVTAADATNLTNRIVAEFNTWGTITVVQGDSGAEFVVRASISRQGNNFVLSARTFDANNRVLNEYNEQARTLNEISISNFCAKAAERVPLPNYLLGTWQSTLNMPDGPVVCIIEFRADRSVRVERYDTWEHKQQNALRYEGYGTGTYTYMGFANRVLSIGGQQVRVDATVGVSLTLEETLPAQTSVQQTGLHLVFNANRTSFDIINGILPCGRNFDGPSVYRSEILGFSQFVKIR